MKNIIYYLIKIWIRAGLYLYYGRLEQYGLEHVPLHKPVLFLPNHQNALLDALLIAVKCGRKPYFLTRSDIFTNRFLNAILNFFRMVPIYRIRDGRQSLAQNHAIFDQCSHLLLHAESILIFPEANHNLRRRVRPLSKGFTRILFNTLEKQPTIDIQLVPIGLNYRDATRFPDGVALYYGKAISVQDLLQDHTLQDFSIRIKEAVFEQLKSLTTHIKFEDSYEETIKRLDSLDVNYLNPSEVNGLIENMDAQEGKPIKVDSPKFVSKWFKAMFILLNFMVILLWRTLIKPTVKEPEFMGTMRFAFSMLAFPIYYILIFALSAKVWNITFAFAVVFCLFAFNWLYVKSHNRSYAQIRES